MCFKKNNNNNGKARERSRGRGVRRDGQHQKRGRLRLQCDRVFIRNVIACQDLRLRALRQFQDTNTINIKGAFAEESATPARAPLKRQRAPRAAAAAARRPARLRAPAAAAASGTGPGRGQPAARQLRPSLSAANESGAGQGPGYLPAPPPPPPPPPPTCERAGCKPGEGSESARLEAVKGKGLPGEGAGGGRWGPVLAARAWLPKTLGDALGSRPKNSKSAFTFLGVTLPSPSQLEGAGVCVCARARAAPPPPSF